MIQSAEDLVSFFQNTDQPLGCKFLQDFRQVKEHYLHHQENNSILIPLQSHKFGSKINVQKETTVIKHS